MSKSFWTAERVATLKKLWAEGRTATQIAALMSSEERIITANAVIGKRRRMELPPRSRHKTSARIPRNVQAVSALMLPTELAEKHECAESHALVPFSDGPHTGSSLEAVLKIKDSQCKWPIGDPTSLQFRFCAKKALASGPYCHEHDEQAYQPSRPSAPRTYIKRTA